MAIVEPLCQQSATFYIKFYSKIFRPTWARSELVELAQTGPPGRVQSGPAPAAKLFLALTLFGKYTEQWPLDNWKYSNNVSREWVWNNIYQSLPCWLFLLMTLALDTEDTAALGLTAIFQALVELWRSWNLHGSSSLSWAVPQRTVVRNWMFSKHRIGNLAKQYLEVLNPFEPSTQGC